MWYELQGQVVRATGVSGTPTIPAGAAILSIQALPATGGGTVAMPDGKGGTVTMTLADGSNGFNYDPKHTSCVTTTANQLVFTGTAEYFVEYMLRSGASVV